MASRYGEMGRPRWDRESKSPPCICKNADTRTGQPRESEWWRWWASPRRDPARCHLRQHRAELVNCEGIVAAHQQMPTPIAHPHDEEVDLKISRRLPLPKHLENSLLRIFVAVEEIDAEIAAARKARRERQASEQ